MKSELAAWNNVPESISSPGSAAKAIFRWPDFVMFEGYILREGFSEASLRGFEQQNGTSRKSVEWLMNHLHIADIQYYGCKSASKDKLLLLGHVLQEIYQAKLLWQFPDRPCRVEFHIPDDEEDLMEYQLSFWQQCHE